MYRKDSYSSTRFGLTDDQFPTSIA